MSFDELTEGQTFQTFFSLSESSVQQFIDGTGDRSPIHVSKAAAMSRGFVDRVVHGAFLTSLATAVVGMDFPGENAIIHSIQFRFHRPVYIDQSIQLIFLVSQLSASVKSAVLKATILSSGEQVQKQVKLATGTIQVGFTETT